MNSLISMHSIGFRTIINASVMYRYYKFEVVAVANASETYTEVNELYIGYNSVKLDYTGITATTINDNGYNESGSVAAIDGTATKWTVGFSAALHPTLIIDFKTARNANSISYQTGSYSAGRAPKSFIFYGSIDNSTWTTLTTQTNVTTPASTSTNSVWWTF